MKADLHCHSHFSFDAWTKPEAFFRFARKKGLDAVAITDHNTTRGWNALQQAAKQSRVQLILGEEIKVYHEGKKAGELLAWFLQEPVSAGSLESVLDAVRAQDALVGIAHPFDQHRNPFIPLNAFAKRVDALETLNARCIFASQNRQAALFAKKQGLSCTGGSDAHSPGEIGSAWTEADCDSLEGFRKALGKGKTVAKGKCSPPWVHVYSSLAKTALRKKP